MSDVLILERLHLILESIRMIEERMNAIVVPADFIRNEASLTLMDAIAMRLQVIGENVKKITTLDAAFFQDKMPMDIDPIVRFRDFISHHYEKTDYEIIFDIC